MKLIHAGVLYEYCIRRNIGGALIWRCAENSCSADFNIGDEARGHVSNTLIYTQMKSFRGFNIGSPYQNRQSAKLKIRKIYVLYGTCWRAIVSILYRVSFVSVSSPVS